MKTDANMLRAWLAMLRFVNLVKKSIDQKFRNQFGMSISRFDVLSALENGNRNGLRAGELSQRLLVTEGNTNQVVGKLIERGLVLKRGSTKDARVVIYSLSDEGDALFQKMAIAHRGWIREAFSDMSEEDFSTLYGVLSRVPLQFFDEERNVA